MNEMHTRYAPLGLRIVAINVDSRAADAERFLTTTPALFAVAYDAKGETPKRFELKAMPTSYLIDPNGRVALVHSGFRDGDRAELEAVLARVLKKGGTP
jgi:peroxiredoxin